MKVVLENKPRFDNSFWVSLEIDPEVSPFCLHKLGISVKSVEEWCYLVLFLCKFDLKYEKSGSNIVLFKFLGSFSVSIQSHFVPILDQFV